LCCGFASELNYGVAYDAHSDNVRAFERRSDALAALVLGVLDPCTGGYSLTITSKLNDSATAMPLVADVTTPNLFYAVQTSGSNQLSYYMLNAAGAQLVQTQFGTYETNSYGRVVDLAIAVNESTSLHMLMCNNEGASFLAVASTADGTWVRAPQQITGAGSLFSLAFSTSTGVLYAMDSASSLYKLSIPNGEGAPTATLIADVDSSIVNVRTMTSLPRGHAVCTNLFASICMATTGTGLDGAACSYAVACSANGSFMANSLLPAGQSFRSYDVNTPIPRLNITAAETNMCIVAPIDVTSITFASLQQSAATQGSGATPAPNVLTAYRAVSRPFLLFPYTGANYSSTIGVLHYRIIYCEKSTVGLFDEFNFVSNVSQTIAPTLMPPPGTPVTTPQPSPACMSASATVPTTAAGTTTTTMTVASSTSTRAITSADSMTATSNALDSETTIATASADVSASSTTTGGSVLSSSAAAQVTTKSKFPAVSASTLTTLDSVNTMVRAVTSAAAGGSNIGIIVGCGEAACCVR
jgi:hypothetical protein